MMRILFPVLLLCSMVMVGWTTPCTDWTDDAPQGTYQTSPSWLMWTITKLWDEGEQQYYLKLKRWERNDEGEWVSHSWWEFTCYSGNPTDGWTFSNSTMGSGTVFVGDGNTSPPGHPPDEIKSNASIFGCNGWTTLVI